MAKSALRRDESDDEDPALLGLFAAIASRDAAEVAVLLEAGRGLASRAIRVGATRSGPDGYFLTAICHYVYAGDTALHVAAAAHQRGFAGSFVDRGADVRARNRRGAQPLHYAADGSPGAPWWDPAAQAEVVTYLIEAGADPNALDDSGVAALHRAVRTRCSGAVRALIDNGADPRLMNRGGSTPLHLAVHNTGRTDSGSDAATDEQARIIAVLVDRGARPTDIDAKGRTVRDAASSDSIRNLLGTR